MNYVVSEILKNRKISDYLASKGHVPVGNQTSGKLRYRCPLHKGDNTPSFMVYQNAEYENFFCFGCKARYSIIHLYRDLERVTTQQAIRALSNGLDLDVDAEISHAIREINDDRSILMEHNVVELSLILNRLLYDFTKEVNFESSCIESADKLFSVIDHLVETGDVQTLHRIQDDVIDAIVEKVRWYRQIQEDRIRMTVNDSRL